MKEEFLTHPMRFGDNEASPIRSFRAESRPPEASCDRLMRRRGCPPRIARKGVLR